MKQSGKLKVLSNDVITHYKEFRTQGKSRGETVSIIREMFFNELQDDDDKIDVLIGLSLALCQKNELTELVALETRDVINCALKNTLCDSRTAQFYEDIIQMLNDESYRGGRSAISTQNAL